MSVDLPTSDIDSRLLAVAMKRLEVLSRIEDFDPNVPGSRPTPPQQEIIDDFGVVRTQWVVAANRSGKSQTCARLIAWALTNTHPSWTVPEQWVHEGLLILVAGKSSKQIEESLWHKIRGYLEVGTYKEIRTGNILQKVEINTPNPDVRHRIVFQSMENVNLARERIQSYDAHIAWADEMIDSAAAINEIRLRVSTKAGIFLCSFTPLKPSVEVKKLIDGAALPHAKRYILKTLDNPVFQDAARREELLATFVGASAAQIATRLHGEWATGESQVYQFDWDRMVEMPQGYSTMWRHVESVDPALKSALGLTVWAEDPQTNKWYCIMAEYVKGIYVPTELVKHVRSLTSHLNVVRRISDPHEVWYIQTASSMGLHYMGVHKKGERKHELIKQLQEFLANGRIRISPTCESLISEFQECRYSDRADDKIVNASSYHLLDSAQYFCDNIPKAEQKIQANSWDEWLYKANEKRKQEAERVRSKVERASLQRRRRSRWN